MLGGSSNDEREMTLFGHLEELRWRLMICVLALFVCTIGCFFISRPALKLLVEPVTNYMPKPVENPAQPERLSLWVAPDGAVRVEDPAQFSRSQKLTSLDVVFMSDQGTTTSFTLLGAEAKAPKIIYTNPVDQVVILMKIALGMGIVLSLGVWVWQIWGFVAPGLTVQEKVVVRPMMAMAIILFPIGAAFAYGMLFFLIRIMQQYAVVGIDTFYSIGPYLKFMTTMMIVFGVIFEMPLAVALLARIGILTPELLREYRRHIYVGLSVVAMVITPADVFSMLIALGPLILLFEVSVLIAVPMARMRGADSDEPEDEVRSA